MTRITEITQTAQETQSIHQIKKLTHEDYPKLKPYYEMYTSEIHDLTLTNQLIWRGKHNLHILELGGYLWFVYHPENALEVSFSEPVGAYDNLTALKNALDEWRRFCLEYGFPMRIRHFGQAFKDALIELEIPFHADEIVDDFDYVYLTDELAKLSGNRFHKKKNHLNQFLKKYENRFKIEAISESNAGDALVAARRWCVLNGCGETLDLCHEYHGILEVLTHWSLMASRGLEGVLVYVDDVPVAMSFGEMIGTQTFLVHIEKADPEVTGAFTVINHALANQVLDRCIYINREQDMGSEGIRKAKLSYHPHHLVLKYDGVIGLDF